MPGGAERFSADAYAVTRGDALGDRDRALAVWRRCGADYSSAFSDGAQRYDWFYTRNPAGPAQLFFLEHRPSAQVVGYLALGARDVLLGGKRGRAGLLVDFVIDREHRVFFPALALQKAALRMASEEFDVLIGFANSSSAAVLRRMREYRELQSVRFVRVIDAGDYLARYLPRAVARVAGWVSGLASRQIDEFRRRAGPRVWSRWADTFDRRYDQLWADAQRAGLCVGVRDRRFLEWRFQSRAQLRYRVLEVMRDGSDTLVGYFVCEIGPRAVAVADLWLAGDMALRTRALLELSTAARSVGARSVSVAVVRNGLLEELLRSCGFYERDRQPVFVALIRAGLVGTCTEWYLTPADADV
jgi:hypothetical protein